MSEGRGNRTVEHRVFECQSVGVWNPISDHPSTEMRGDMIVTVKRGI